MSSTLDRQTGGTILPMRLGFRLSPVIAIVLALGLAAPADAQAPAATRLTMAGQPAYADQATHLQIRLLHADDTPVVAGEVVVERRRSGTWRPIGTVLTNNQGRAVVDATLFRRAANNVFRASYAGDLDSAPDKTGPVAGRPQAAEQPGHGRWTRLGGRRAVGAGVRAVADGQRAAGQRDRAPAAPQRRRRLAAGPEAPHRRRRPRAHHHAPPGRHQLARPGEAPRLGLRRHQRRPPDQQPPARRAGPAAEARRRGPGSTCPTSGMPSAPDRTRTSRGSRRASGTR